FGEDGGKDIEGHKHLQPSAKNMAKKKLQSRKRGDEGDRLFRCSSRRLAVTSWIRVVEGGWRRIRIEKGLRIEVLLILLLLTLLSTPSPSFSFDASSLTVARLQPTELSRSKSTINTCFER
ncbi:hypothetical protein B296_00026017, partial [Ensete ventricosum]